MTANQPGKIIDEVWLFVSDDSGEEGVVAAFLGGTWMPLVAADLERVEVLRPLAQEVATRTGRRVEIRHFVTVTDVQEIEP